MGQPAQGGREAGARPNHRQTSRLHHGHKLADLLALVHADSPTVIRVKQCVKALSNPAALLLLAGSTLAVSDVAFLAGHRPEGRDVIAKLLYYMLYLNLSHIVAVGAAGAGAAAGC